MLPDNSLGFLPFIRGEVSRRYLQPGKWNTDTPAQVGVFAALHKIRSHAKLRADSFVIDPPENHTNRPGDGVGSGQNFIAIHGNPVAAGSGNLALRNNHRFRFAAFFEGFSNQIAGHAVAAGRIDPEDDRFDRFAFAEGEENSFQPTGANTAIHGADAQAVNDRNFR